MSQEHPLITLDERDLVHILRVVLGENKGVVLTDSKCFVIENEILRLLKVMPANNGEG